MWSLMYCSYRCVPTAFFGTGVSVRELFDVCLNQFAVPTGVFKMGEQLKRQPPAKLKLPAPIMKMAVTNNMVSEIYFDILHLLGVRKCILVERITLRTNAQKI